MTGRNDGGEDYEAKAHKLLHDFAIDDAEEDPSRVWLRLAPQVATALAQSAADERKRTIKECVKMLRAKGPESCERGMTDPSTGAFECRRADRGECNCYEFDELADAIAARAETKGAEK